MSVEQLIVSKILEESSLVECQRSGLKPIYFQGEWAGIYQWLLSYNTEHGAVPSVRAFSKAYGDVELDNASAETFSGLFAELVEQYQTRVIAAGITDAMGPLDKGDVIGAMALLSQALSAGGQTVLQLRDFNIIEGWEERYQQYVEMRDSPNALRGIPTGFTGLDRITHGLRPQQFIVMVGEQKRGKSLFELIMAIACHIYGKRPMIVSFEMAVAEQLARYDALTAHVPYDRILSGQMTDAELERVRRQMIQHKNMQPFIMSEDSTSLTTLSALAAKVQEYLPDALYIDGIYLMDDENGEPKGSPQALTNISRGLKRLAQQFNIPVVGTSQVLSWKINNKRTRAITADAIGYTSSFAQDADLILGVERNPDAEDEAIIRVVEARTAPRAQIFVRWDWNAMTFEEVNEPDQFDTSFD
jgi:KaiC/GvpD/RAD55 family RecA-like ATPase